ncbi:glutathione synthase [Rhodoferax sp. 4810]|uniref:Glutathione synthetase n=1 Tax=Thiospirillum jenense TaxID=1653858 RepID=A0A839H5G4_9GAMM|nr:glutathione synthase [Thiospirillum jenense]MBB1073850.1 glutathione synthase [Rhodoferax jenense]MBB1125195.1 glutathione synthase [Thiospirillum jenense]
MPRQLGVLMDPIAGIQIKKDSTFAMLLAAQQRGWSLQYFEIGDLLLRDGQVFALSRDLRVWDDAHRWFELNEPRWRPFTDFDLVLMRKDPPFNMEYIYATYLLELAQAQGCWVINDPRTLRDANEKLAVTSFPDLTPPMIVTRQQLILRDFLREQGEIVVKPLDGMGGRSIFRVRHGDPNVGVIFETLTAHAQQFCMAQRFIPEICRGDKRILIVAGQPVAHLLARIPSAEDSRGNLAAGAIGEVRPLSDRDRHIAERVGATLLQRGIWFAGLDVIGDWLTEINITSPTCIRELDRACGSDIAADLLVALEQQLLKNTHA